MLKNKQVLDLTEEIEELKKELKQTKLDNLMLAKEIDRLNEFFRFRKEKLNN